MLGSGIRTGIDLGTASVKLVRGEGAARLERITHAEVEEWDLVATGDAVRRAGGALERILKRLGPTRRNLGRIAVAVGSEEGGLREVVLPLRSEEEVHRAIPFEAREHLALVESAAPTVAYQVLGSVPASEAGGHEAMRVLLAAASAAQREFPLRVLARFGLEPEVIDIEALAALNALLATLPPEAVRDCAVGLLDLGAQEAQLYVTQAEGGLLTRALGDAFTDPDDEVGVQGYAAGLIQRLRETLTFYRGRYRREVTSLFLCGGGARPPSIRTALRDALDLPVSVLNPFSDTVLSSGIKLDEPDAARFVTACGLCRWWDGGHV